MTNDTTVRATVADDRTKSAGQVCRAAQVLIIVIAALLHIIFLAKAKPLQSANDRSRWCTVWSLVELGTFQIDEIRQRPGWDTIDLVHVDDHFYSTKPPLLTSIVAGITWGLQRITGWNLLDDTQSLTALVLIIINIIPFVASLWVWVLILDQIAAKTWTRLFVLTIAAFGTLLTPFLMAFNNHTVAAAAVTFAIYGLLQILSERSIAKAPWSFALCGFAASWATANELPAALFLLIAFILAWRQSSRLTLAWFVPAAAIPLVALVVTNVIATGSWKPFYADYGTDKYRFVIDGIPSYWSEPHGIDRNLDSPGMYFVHCTVGHHGLLSLTPIALLALAGWIVPIRMQDRTLKTLLRLGFLTTAVVIAFYMTRTQNYNYGGVSCGLRWALWLTPFWLIALVPLVDRLGNRNSFRYLAVGLTCVSLCSAWLPIDNPWRQPWLFQWMESRGWIDYSDPPVTLKRPLWTWFASLPQQGVNEPYWIEFSIAQPGLDSRSVRLSARSRPDQKPDEPIELLFEELAQEQRSPISSRKLQIRAPQFLKGSPPAEFLVWSDPSVSPARQQSDLAFVRGLPSKVPYKARTIRYLKTPLRKEAIKCVLAAAHVSWSPSDHEKPRTYRCDVWLSDEVPFGVVQAEFHISDPETAATLFHERWTVKNSFPPVKLYTAP